MADPREKYLAAIGDRIRARRQEERLTQEKLAELADVSVGTIKNAEVGRPVMHETMVRISVALGIQQESLFSRGNAKALPSRDQKEQELMKLLRFLPEEYLDAMLQQAKVMARYSRVS